MSDTSSDSEGGADDGQLSICDVCGKGFANATYVNRHKKQVHNEISADHQQCPKCPQSFKCLKKFWQHVLVFHENQRDDMPAETPKRFHSDSSNDTTCDQCDRSFFDRSSLRRHFRVVHSDSPRPTFPCPKCDKVFLRKESLELHLQTNRHGALVFPCDLCSLTFGSSEGLLRHNRNVHNLIEYVTSVRVGSASLRDPGPPPTCHKCGKICYDKSSLRRHLSRTHTDHGRTFGCPECGKMFKDNKGLQNHMIVHKNIVMEPHIKAMLKTVFGTVCSPTFTCGLCGSVVQSSMEARLHLYIKHPDKFHELITQKSVREGIPCTRCSVVVTSKEDMILHLVSHHPDRKVPTCNFCGHKEVKERDLNYHYKVAHPQTPRHVCEICTRTFAQRRALEGHVKREHSEEAGQCPYCSEKHMRVKMHVTMRHPEKAEEYKRIWTNAIRHDQVERMKFNEFLENGRIPQQAKPVTKRKKKQESCDEERDKEGENSGSEFGGTLTDFGEEFSDEEETKVDIEMNGKVNPTQVALTRPISLDKYTIEKSSLPHVIQVNRLPPPEPEIPLITNSQSGIHDQEADSNNTSTVEMQQTSVVVLQRLTEQEVADLETSSLKASNSPANPLISTTNVIKDPPRRSLRKRN